MKYAILAVLALVSLSAAAHANPAIIGIAVIAGEVLSPVAATVGIIKDGPDAWTTIQGWVDPRALELPPQPEPR